jgi:hypothetical protein
MRSLMFQASIPASYWVEALHTATYLLNRHPTKTLDFHTPYFALYGSKPSYDHLRVLVVSATLTYLPPLHISSLLDPPYVSF